MNLEKVSREVLQQNKEIHLFRDDDVLSITQMILNEAQELVEATETAFLTDDLTAVASEAGDCLYLLIRLFDMLGIDERAVEIKKTRNDKKYRNYKSKEEAVLDWKNKGGDAVFFEDYLNNCS
jgi:NTP pyrophosphatase (non-canonical NTP hydrolase)